MYKIFDIHTHIYPNAIAEKAVTNLNAFYSFVCEGLGTADDMVPAEIEAKCCGALLLGVATTAHQVSRVNEALADACRTYTDNGFTLLAYGCMHQDSEDKPAIVEDILKMRLRGIKIHPDIQGVNIDDERMMPMYEAAEGRLPIYFHMGDDREEYQFSATERLVRIKKRFPKLEVIAAHLGGYRSWHKAGQLAALDNIWFDTSSALWAMTPERAKELIDLLGYERVMYGTDYPVAYPGSELTRFFAIELSEKERCAILYDNAARMLAL